MIHQLGFYIMLKFIIREYDLLIILGFFSVYSSIILADVLPANLDLKGGLKSNVINNVNKFSCSANQDAPDLSGRDEKAKNNRENALNSVDERLIKSCVIGFDEVQRRLLSKSVTLVDIRSAKEFENYRITESINLSSYLIKSKDYLKSKHLVLVGDKVDLLELGLLCRELKEHGFKKVNFLKDGMSPWSGRLIGQNAESTDGWQFGKIEPREFTSLKSKLKWMVLDTRNSGLTKRDFDFIYQGLDVIAFRGGNANDLEKVNNFMSSQASNNLYGFLVISERGDDYRDIAGYLEKNHVNNIFYMDGGLINYSSYLADRNAFLARLKRGPADLRTCGNT
ncbi:MAG: rhodanese-like domain-containing protein [Candidatus Pacearchaeota archaeon]|nr:rhodanese-like domain-containing protein [Candidatus Pacearchaeota archaeon]